MKTNKIKMAFENALKATRNFESYDLEIHYPDHEQFAADVTELLQSILMEEKIKAAKEHIDANRDNKAYVLDFISRL